MIEAKHRFFSNYKAAANVFITVFITDWLNNNIVINKQISMENANFPRSLVQLGIGSVYAVPIDQIKGLVHFNLFAQSEWERQY